MQHNSLNLIEEIEKLVEHYDLSVSEISIGNDPAIPVKLRIEKANIEIVTMAKHCAIRNGKGKSKLFDKSDCGWCKKSLEYIEEIITAYKK